MTNVWFSGRISKSPNSADRSSSPRYYHNNIVIDVFVELNSGSYCQKNY